MIQLMLTIIPAILPGNIALSLLFFGIAYAVFTLKLQRKIAHPQKTREMQAKIKALTKELNEMAKRKEDITAKQAELMPLVKKSMSFQMRSMFVVLPLFFLVYYVAIPTVYGAFTLQYVNFIIPMTYQSVFFFTILISGIVGSMVMLVHDKKRYGNPSQQPAPQQA